MDFEKESNPNPKVSSMAKMRLNLKRSILKMKNRLKFNQELFFRIMVTWKRRNQLNYKKGTCFVA